LRLLLRLQALIAPNIAPISARYAYCAYKRWLRLLLRLQALVAPYIAHISACCARRHKLSLRRLK